jgi:rhomboid-like protein
MWMNRIAQHIAKQRAQITDKLNAKVNPFLNQIKGSKLGKKVFNNSKQQSREYTNHLTRRQKFRVVSPFLFTAAGIAGAIYGTELWHEYNVQKDPYGKNVKRRSQEKPFIPINADTWTAMKIRWRHISDSDKFVGGMIAVNAAIFMAWNFLFPLKGFMYKYFTHNAFSGRNLTLLTSNWSHMGGTHLVFNMFALWSFGRAVYDLVGKERFVGLYVTTGLLGSFASHMFHGMLRVNTYSLGASGAIYGLLGFVAYFFPDAKAQLLFVLPVKMGAVFKGLLGFEGLGLTALWTRLFGLNFDHAAHLGGLLGGYAYAHMLYEKARRRRAAMEAPKQ